MSVNGALELPNDCIVRYRGQPVGTSAACDPGPVAASYTECFVRDFAPSALVFLMRGQPAIVRNFLTTVMLKAFPSGWTAGWTCIAVTWWATRVRGGWIWMRCTVQTRLDSGAIPRTCCEP